MPANNSRPIPKTHNCNYKEAEPQFVPHTMEYARVARLYEKYNNNNCGFNGKSLSDNCNQTRWYVAKARGDDWVKPLGPLVNNVEGNEKQHLPVDEPVNDKENTPIIYSQNMLEQLCDDNAGITVSKMPSNLTEIPKVHEKYEIASFCKTSS